MSPVAARQEPFFLPGPNGQRFCVLHRPTTTPVHGHVLLAPAFNEEMNRCRSMVTLQAQAWARHGYGTLVIDPLGTGDSDGEYTDARWEFWLDDLNDASRWLSERGERVAAIWGIRLGALLAAQAIARQAVPAVPLIFWQPVHDGKVHMTQFLRLRIAAAIDRTDIPKETTASLRQQLAAGELVEVGGYPLHPALVASIESSSLTKVELARGQRVFWAEHTTETQPDLSPASASCIERWESAGARVEKAPFQGPPFWQVHERVITPEVIALSTRWLAATRHGPSEAA